jgi:hypothetical protein
MSSASPPQASDIFNFPKIKALYDEVKSQNDLIDVRLDELKDKYTLNDSTSSYIKKETDIIKHTGAYLFYVYYVSIIILSVVLFIYKPLNFTSLIIIVILLLLSPLYLVQFELFMYNVLQYVYSFLLGIVYKKV